jgi:hypothetical protein
MKVTAAARPFVGGPEIGRCEGGDDADVHAGDERPDGEQRGPREAIDDEDGSDDDGKACRMLPAWKRRTWPEEKLRLRKRMGP